MVIIGCSRKCYCNMSHYLIPIQHSPGFSQKTFEYYIFCVFFNSYSKSFNQNTAFIGYDVLIDQFGVRVQSSYSKMFYGGSPGFVSLLVLCLTKMQETIFFSKTFDSNRIWTTNFHTLNWSRDGCICMLLAYQQSKSMFKWQKISWQDIPFDWSPTSSCKRTT